MSFSFKSIRVGLSIAVIFVLFLFIDTKSLLNVVAEIKIGPLLVSLACILLSQYLSSIRFYFILRDNNINVPRSDAFRANIYGLVGGMMLLNLLGQGLTRSVVLHRFQVPQSTIFLLTALERLAALFVLLAAAVIGLALVFRRFPISFNEDALILVRYAVAGSCTLIFVVLLGLTARQRRLIRQLAGQIFSFATLRLIGITVLMHGAMLASYIIIAKSLRPQLEIISTTAASVVVMFVASLPISFAGWGFRELSAAFAFARIGLTPEQGVLIGVTIGVLSILSLVGNAAWVGFRRIRTGSPKEALPRALIRGDSLERISYWLIGIGASVAAFFQILVPTNSGHLNVNLGDPFAIVGGLVLASIALRMRSIDFFWRVRSVVLVLGAVTTVLAIGLLNGYLAYGPIHWAIFNRFTGWFILLGYFFSGTLLISAVGRIGLASVSRVLGATAAGLVVWEFGIRLLSLFGLTIAVAPSIRAEGMVGNPNAFAFQLLMAFVALFASADFLQNKNRRTATLCLTGLILAGIWIAGSVAAAGALVVAILLMFAFLWQTVEWRKVGARLMLSAGLAVALLLGANLVANLAGTYLGETGKRGRFAGLILSSADVQADRIESLLGSLKMWAEHPILGAGLGAYIHEHIVQTGLPLVIHNSFLWIAAELGLLGLAAYGALAIIIGRAALSGWKTPQREDSSVDSRVVLIGAVTALFVMALVHDVLYQRLFWFLLGATLAAPGSLIHMRRVSTWRNEIKKEFLPELTSVSSENIDAAVARGFGHEWSTFRQGERDLLNDERQTIFQSYFGIFPWEKLPSDGGVGIDIGCGSGRWSMMIAPRVAHLHLLDVSPDALVVAKENLSGARNVSFHLASVNEIPLAPQSLDFAVALGVLHHVPDTQAAINKIAGKLKPGAPFMVYLYYAFDNRPSWYRMLWKASDRLRILVAQLPHPLRFVLSQLIALFVYWPLARLSKLADKLGFPVRSMPLSWYRDKSFYVMRTDAYDRFCTSLEKRFTREQIAAMFAQAGFRDIRFSESEPYWCAVGFKG